MKRALLIGGALVVLALAGAGFYLYMRLDFLIQHAIQDYGTEILQAKVEVGSLKISPRSGEGKIERLHIGNPQGFKADYALRVGRIDLAVDPATLTDDVIVIKKITVSAPSLIYEQSRSGNNFDVLQRNVAAYIGDTSAEEKKSETKLIVEDLRIEGARVSYLPLIPTPGVDLSFTLPDIHLHNLGKKRGGLTPAELTQTIVNALLTRTAAAVGHAAVPQILDRFFNQ